MLERRICLSTATFFPPQHYSFSSTARATAMGDFNGDGSPDIATVLPDDSAIGILLNNGDGTFRRGPTIPDGSPRAVAAADFDHNGTVDLVVLGNDGSTTDGLVEIFNGNGDGTFAKPTLRYRLFAAGPEIFAVDVNGDGYADIVAETGQRVAVLINQQNGTFAKPVYYDIGGEHPTGLAIGDLNGDGLADLAISSGKKGYISVLLNNPAAPGTFALPLFYPTGGNASSVAIGDFNNDGHLDLAATNSNFQGTALAVLIGNGNGTFRPPAFYGGANFAGAVAAGDFSGNGIQDIVVGSFDSELKLFPGNGDGTFGTPVVISGGLYSQRIVTGDFNGDGRLDLLLTPYAGVRVLLNSTGLVPTPPSGGGFDKILGAGSPKSFGFYTPEGTRATVSLSGPGSATLQFSASSTIPIPNGRGTRNVTALTLANVLATATTAATTLSISTQAGSQTITLNSISADSAIGALRASRANLTGNLTLPGGVGQISLLSANNGTIAMGPGPKPSITLQQIGNETINSVAPVASINVRLDAGIMLTAPSIGTLSVGGNLINSALTLTAPVAAGASDLMNLSIHATLLSSAIYSAGNIATIAARNMIGSVIQAGVGPLPPGQGLPASASDFIASASIGTVTLMSDSRRLSFANSTIAASRLGTLKLARIQTANGGTPFGVAAGFISQLAGLDIAGGRSFRLSKISTPQAAADALAKQHIDPQDFAVTIV